MSELLTHVCSVCDLPTDNSEARSLTIGTCRELRVLHPGEIYESALDEERAYACGQQHALVLTERYLERGTFAPADHTVTASGFAVEDANVPLT